MIKEFKIKALPDKNMINELACDMKIGKVLSALLLQRGISSHYDAEEFLTGTRIFMHDPFLMKDMDKAVEIMGSVHTRGGRVCIFGDYDVDGISALALMYTSLLKLGFNVSWFLPDRQKDLYDLQVEQVKQIGDMGCDLLITADCGSNAKESVAYAKKLGMKVIVTDHHIVTEAAEPDAFINPMQEDCEYPYKYLCGCSVAYKLIMGYTLKYSLDPWGFTRSVMDLLCLATVADYMPMTGENRVIVKSGMDSIMNTSRVGLACLLREAGIYKNLSCKLLQYRVIPKLNSAGRMGKTETAFRLLIENNFETSEILCKEVCDANKKRQEIEDLMEKEAVEIIEKKHYENDKILVVYRKDWESSMCGNLAARLCKKYNKPSIAIGSLKNYAKGSGRNYKDFNIFEATEGGSDALIKFGGHKSALGVTLLPERVDEFREKINKNLVIKEEPEKEAEYDLCLKLGALDMALCIDLEKMMPFGDKNPEPVFVSRGVVIKQVYNMGRDKQHTKLVFEKNPGDFIECVMWNKTDEALVLGAVLDVAYTMEVNDFNFQKIPQMVIKDYILK